MSDDSVRQERAGLPLEAASPACPSGLRSPQPGSSLHAGFFPHGEGEIVANPPERFQRQQPRGPAGCTQPLDVTVVPRKPPQSPGLRGGRERIFTPAAVSAAFSGSVQPGHTQKVRIDSGRVSLFTPKALRNPQTGAPRWSVWPDDLPLRPRTPRRGLDPRRVEDRRSLWSTRRPGCSRLLFARLRSRRESDNRPRGEDRSRIRNISRFQSGVSKGPPKGFVQDVYSIPFWDRVGDLLTRKVEQGDAKAPKFLQLCLLIRKELINCEMKRQPSEDFSFPLLPNSLPLHREGCAEQPVPCSAASRAAVSLAHHSPLGTLALVAVARLPIIPHSLLLTPG
ncbi:uncharacterized protein LOC120762208 [Hirundo rustica]|uniref:uncharacterized protein LOC120762208 n=1 Tax=Hirundo rustica TaxID=43150 RepID=UPI001A951E27|nr:uncharacterized protein LOC120762208 [Hirundo rustica]